MILRIEFMDSSAANIADNMIHNVNWMAIKCLKNMHQYIEFNVQFIHDHHDVWGKI